MAPRATPMSLASIGTSICSDAYLSRKPTPKKSTMTPKRTNVLPPKKKFQRAEGDDGSAVGRDGVKVLSNGGPSRSCAASTSADIDSESTVVIIGSSLSGVVCDRSKTA